MNRIGTLLVLCATVVAVSVYSQDASAQAKEAVGKIGLGYTTSNAPLGVRMWLEDRLAIDAGLGIFVRGREIDVEDPPDAGEPPNETETMDWAVDLGALYALKRRENAIFYVRGGLNVDRRYATGLSADGDAEHDSQLTFTLSGWGGIELFMTELGFPNLSVQAAVGLGYQYITGPDNKADDDDETDWSFGSSTSGLNLVGTTQLGFHYYF